MQKKEAAIKKREEELKEQHKEELQKKEAEAKLKYQTPEQRAEEEVQEKEAKIYIEKRKLLKKLKIREEVLLIKEGSIKEHFKRIKSLTEIEIPELKKEIDNIKTQIKAMGK